MKARTASLKSLVIVLAFSVACTKRNENLCCTDEADCAAAGLPDGTDCEDGLLCRGNEGHRQCVVLTCMSSAQCDIGAPYCGGDRCQASCESDTQCPGFGETGDQSRCEQGACVQCRSSEDCSATAPICDGGGCRACREHSECASGVCADDGTCVDEVAVAYVSANGGQTECGRVAPCSFTRALQLTPAREFLKLNSGTYQNVGTVTLQGRRHLIGDSTDNTVLTNIQAGPVFTLGLNADIAFDTLQVSGARNGTSATGHGVDVPGGLAATVRLRRALFARNAAAGVNGRQCSVFASETKFTENGDGLHLVDSTATVDRSVSTQNSTGFFFDAGIYTVTNTFVVRNSDRGINIFPSAPGNSIEYSTIVDNGTGVECISSGTTSATFPNNIVARNGVNTAGSGCTFTTSLIIGADITQLAFKHADAAPFDYHITAESIAVDAAAPNPSILTDFDGEARPTGGAPDIGADELQ